MMDMIETDTVASNLKRAYREASPQKLPPQMQELLRRLGQQDKNDQ